MVRNGISFTVDFQNQQEQFYHFKNFCQDWNYRLDFIMAQCQYHILQPRQLLPDSIRKGWMEDYGRKQFHPHSSGCDAHNHSTVQWTCKQERKEKQYGLEDSKCLRNQSRMILTVLQYS